MARANADSQIRFAAQAFLLEGAFLFAASFCAIGYRGNLLEDSFQTLALIALTALALGTRNAAVRKPCGLEQRSPPSELRRCFAHCVRPIACEWRVRFLGGQSYLTHTAQRAARADPTFYSTVSHADTIKSPTVPEFSARSMAEPSAGPAEITAMPAFGGITP
jgi:hypothetical protein